MPQLREKHPPQQACNLEGTVKESGYILAYKYISSTLLFFMTVFVKILVTEREWHPQGQELTARTWE